MGQREYFHEQLSCHVVGKNGNRLSGQKVLPASASCRQRKTGLPCVVTREQGGSAKTVYFSSPQKQVRDECPPAWADSRRLRHMRKKGKAGRKAFSPPARRERLPARYPAVLPEYPLPGCSPEGREARRHSLRKAGDGQTWGKAHGTPCGCRSENAVDRRENMLLRRFRECNGPVSTRSGPFPGIKYGLAWTVGRNRKMPWESLEKMSQYREIRTADGVVGSLPACVS